MKNNVVIIAVIALIVGGAGGFFGGMKYQESKSSSQQFGGRSGNSTFGGGNGGGRFGGRGVDGGGSAVVGQVISTDEKSLTVKLQDGSSKIILVSDKTTINKASLGTLSDVKSGETVAVFGTANSDGSVTAQSVQLNPMFGGRRSQTTPP